MAKQTWGLDIGEWSLKIVRGSLDRNTGNIRVDLYDEIRYHELGLEDDVSSLEKFRAGLVAFGNNYDVPKGDNLCVAVSGSEVFSRFINLPPVPESISEIIRYEARQQIPFDISEVVWDYQPIKDDYQPGEEIEVGLFALKRETVDEFMDMLEPWRHNLRVIQDGPLAVYNFLRFEGLAEEPIIVLDVGAHTTDVLVLNHPRFWIRPLLVAGGDITERLQSHFGVSQQESERIKARASESAHEAQVLRVIRPVVANMVSEIQRSLGYYKSIARGVKFAKILALGSAFKLRGLDRLLAEGLQYDIERLGELTRFDVAPELEEDFKEHLSGACGALGLLAQGTGQGHMKINLVPEELSTALAMAAKKLWLVGAAVGVLLMAAILMMAEKVYARGLSEQAGVGTVLLEKLKRYENDYKSAEKKTDSKEAALASLTRREVDRNILTRVIPAITQELPDTIFIWKMECAWMEKAAIESLKGEGAKRTAEESGRITAGAPTGRPGMRPGVPADKRAQPRTATRTAKAGKAHLVVILDCESTVTAGFRPHLEEKVIKRFEDLREIIDEVGLVGGMQNIRDVNRDVLSGEVIGKERDSKGVPAVHQARPFVAFQLFMVINTDGEPEPRKKSDT